MRVRLSGGNSGNDWISGFVEVLDENFHWGGVCGTNFDKKAAKVVCNMLGYQTPSAIKKLPYDNNFVLDLSSSCLGEEHSLFDCSISDERNICSAGEIASFKCCKDVLCIQEADLLDENESINDLC